MNQCKVYLLPCPKAKVSPKPHEKTQWKFVNTKECNAPHATSTTNSPYCNNPEPNYLPIFSTEYLAGLNSLIQVGIDVF